jgi:thiol-disulfide isomerase/thioredoxin
MKKLKKPFFLGLFHLIICVLSGALGWDIQTVVVSFMSFISLYFACKNISNSFFLLIVIITPFFLLYSISSIKVGNPLNYPVWICGIAVSIISILLLKFSVKREIVFLVILIILLTEYTFIYPNAFTYLTKKPIPSKHNLLNAKIVDINNKEVKLNKFENKVVLLDIWHSACYPCIEQFPKLQSLYNEFKADTSVQIISLNIPLKKDAGKKPDRVTINYSFEKLYFFNEEEYEKFSDKVVPLILIIDKNMNCRYAGDLNLGWNIFIGNAKRIIKKLKEER